MLHGGVAIITQKYSVTQQGPYPFKNCFAIHMANPKRTPEKLVESLKHLGRSQGGAKLFCRNWAATQPEIKELGDKKESFLSNSKA